MLRTLAAVTLIALALGTSALAQDIGRKDLTAGIDQQTPGGELFLRLYEVFSHPRCSNCHPRDDRPRWGTTAIRLHAMNVQRGVDQPAPPEGSSHTKPEGGYGPLGMTCSTCHGQENGVLPGSPPGARNWRLAPKRMGWQGLTAVELCQQFKDAAVGKSNKIKEVMHHIVPYPKEDLKRFEPDPLVEWAWDPGPGREPAPGDLAQFVQVLTWWMMPDEPLCPPR
jgi:hypothetical protein